MHDDLRPPKELNPEVPEYLSDIIMKAMAMDEDERFQSSEEFMKALKGHQIDKTPAKKKPKKKKKKGNSVLKMAVAVVLTLLLCAGAFWGITNHTRLVKMGYSGKIEFYVPESKKDYYGEVVNDYSIDYDKEISIVPVADEKYKETVLEKLGTKESPAIFVSDDFSQKELADAENMEKYELGIAVQKVYDFLWDELCDWYIEMAKVRLWKAEEDPKAANDALWTLRTALTEGLKLLHPYMPFITEEIYCTLLPEEESIMISEWPVYREERNFPDAEKAIEGFKEVVRGIRNTRTEMNVPNNRKTSLHIVAKDAETAAMYENSKKSFVNLAFAKEILVQTDKNGISEDAVSVVVSNAVVYMPLEDLIDKDKEIERLTKETERLTKEIARCEGMLNNPNFVNKAPAAKVDAEKDKLAKYKEMMDKVKGQLEQLKK